jgi:ribosome recycling factor
VRRSSSRSLLSPKSAAASSRRSSKTKGEEAKISVRNARRDANDLAKKLEKDGDLPEDDAKRLLDRVQKMTDDYVHRVDDLVSKKEKELMEV